jgi:hypothetical protein
MVSVTRVTARHCEHRCPQFNQNVVIAASGKGEGLSCAHFWDCIEVMFVT